jgi:hypothetical protein
MVLKAIPNTPSTRLGLKSTFMLILPPKPFRFIDELHDSNPMKLSLLTFPQSSARNEIRLDKNQFAGYNENIPPRDGGV